MSYSSSLACTVWDTHLPTLARAPTQGALLKVAEMYYHSHNQYGSSHTDARLCSASHELTRAQVSPLV